MAWTAAAVCLAFVLFFLYDVAGATGRLRPFRLGFAAGCLLLAGTAGWLIWSAGGRLGTRPVPAVVGGTAALLFALILIYTLFIVLPFGETYVSEGAAAPLYTRGVYALCRHPGVLWLIGLTAGLWLAVGTAEAMIFCLLVSILDTAYAAFQDRWTFPKLFPGYGAYRRAVPFLIPSVRSVRRCVQTLSRKGESNHDL